MGTVTVHARRGPLAGRRVEIDEADVKAATADDGWAQTLEPGTVLETDTAAPFNPKWKIPGYDAPPDQPAAKEAAAEDESGDGDDNGDGDDAGTTTGSTRSTRGRRR